MEAMVFKQMELVLTGAYLALAAVLLLILLVRLRGLLSGRVARKWIWDESVTTPFRLAKFALAVALGLLVPGLIYALSVLVIFTAVVRAYAGLLLFGTLCVWAVVEIGLCASVGERLMAGSQRRKIAFVATVLAVLPVALYLFHFIPRTLPFPDEDVCEVLDLPVRGDWLAGHAGATRLTNAHTRNRYAIDMLKLGPDARIVNGPDSIITNWYGYGECVYAPVTGLVLEVEDGHACGGIGHNDRDNPRGNHIVMEVSNGGSIVLAHLQRGSVACRAGMTVAQGALLGRVGNSGNSEVPHLHVHVEDAAGNPRPFRFRRMQRKRWNVWREVENGDLIRNDRFRESSRNRGSGGEAVRIAADN
jgi:hypothetical protein